MSEEDKQKMRDMLNDGREKMLDPNTNDKDWNIAWHTATLACYFLAKYEAHE